MFFRILRKWCQLWQLLLKMAIPSQLTSFKVRLDGVTIMDDDKANMDVFIGMSCVFASYWVFGVHYTIHINDIFWALTLWYQISQSKCQDNESVWHVKDSFQNGLLIDYKTDTICQYHKHVHIFKENFLIKVSLCSHSPIYLPF